MVADADVDAADVPGVDLVNLALELLLELGRRTMSSEVEIEFALDLDPLRRDPPTFGFLQVRPIVVSREQVDLTEAVLVRLGHHGDLRPFEAEQGGAVGVECDPVGAGDHDADTGKDETLVGTAPGGADTTLEVAIEVPRGRLVHMGGEHGLGVFCAKILARLR